MRLWPDLDISKFKYMGLTERSEIVSDLYKLRAELGCLFLKCQDARALATGVSVQAAQNDINEALADYQPDPPCPAPMEFPEPKK